MSRDIEMYDSDIEYFEDPYPVDEDTLDDTEYYEDTLHHVGYYDECEEDRDQDIEDILYAQYEEESWHEYLMNEDMRDD